MWPRSLTVASNCAALYARAAGTRSRSSANALSISSPRRRTRLAYSSSARWARRPGGAPRSARSSAISSAAEGASGAQATPSRRAHRPSAPNPRPPTTTGTSERRQASIIRWAYGSRIGSAHAKATASAS